MLEKRQGKTNKLVTLFVATALVAATGCSNTAANSNCIDQNRDGYCDNGGGGGGSSGAYYGGSSGTSGKSSSSGISTSSSHSGIGSSSGSSSG